jgi:hypothetical protein
VKKEILLGFVFLLLATLLTYARNEYYFSALTPCKDATEEQQALLGKKDCVSSARYNSSSQFYTNHLGVAAYSLQNHYFTSLILIGLIIGLSLKKRWGMTAGVFVVLVVLCSQNATDFIFPAHTNVDGTPIDPKDIAFVQRKSLEAFISSVPYVACITLAGVFLGKLVTKLYLTQNPKKHK